MSGNISNPNRHEVEAAGIVKANGEWHTIMSASEVNIFEVVAVAYGKQGEGQYASIYAIASNAYSGKWGSIRSFKNYYSWKWWKRLRLRWTGNPFEYQLQIKTCSDYDSHGEIDYKVYRLGGDFTYKADKI